jgi:DUF971 family protein
VERRKNRPRQVELLSDELVIYWRDGSQSRYALELLRRLCPCALCRVQREAPQASPAGELTILSAEAVSATAQAVRFDYVGRYGIRIAWADGHDQGIYTFEFLREMDEAAA